MVNITLPSNSKCSIGFCLEYLQFTLSILEVKVKVIHISTANISWTVTDRANITVAIKQPDSGFRLIYLNLTLAHSKRERSRLFAIKLRMKQYLPPSSRVGHHLLCQPAPCRVDVHPAVQASTQPAEPCSVRRHSAVQTLPCQERRHPAMQPLSYRVGAFVLCRLPPCRVGGQLLRGLLFLFKSAMHCRLFTQPSKHLSLCVILSKWPCKWEYKM